MENSRNFTMNAVSADHVVVGSVVNFLTFEIRSKFARVSTITEVEESNSFAGKQYTIKGTVEILKSQAQRKTCGQVREA